jgi:hypothetical protein
VRRTCFDDGRKRVNDHAAGLMLANGTLDFHQVDFRAGRLSARRMHPQDVFSFLFAMQLTV